MTVTFFSNYLNHHQSPFCDEMYKRLKNDFVFVSNIETPEERLKKGYPDCSGYVYNLLSYRSSNEYNKALELGSNSDIVIIGSAPGFFIKDRLAQNKPVFRYCERLFKKGFRQLLDYKYLSYLIRTHTFYRKKNVFLLCAGAFAANDMRWLCAYPGKKFKWGYFTSVEDLNIEQILSKKADNPIEIIWVGRFISWKHPEYAVDLAYQLKNKGHNFHITMIGSGILSETIQTTIEKLSLSDCIEIIGNIPNSEVRNRMKQAAVMIFTSDRNEGWGAVLNEAMGCGCAVIASGSIGSVPYLIDHEKNGLIFSLSKRNDLLEQTEKLIDNKPFREELSINAYHTLVDTWNPKIAAENFLLLAESVMEGKTVAFDNGPCSKAMYIKKNYWK